PLQKAAKQQPAKARRRRAEQEYHAIPQQPGAEHAAVAEDVAEPPESEHQAGMGQDIADDHPLDHLDRQAKATGDGGGSDVYPAAERHNRGAEPDQHEPQPLPRRHPRPRCNGLFFPAMREFTGKKSHPTKFWPLKITVYQIYIASVGTSCRRPIREIWTSC